ncbi:MAG TPA: amidohydrolase family protein, partial [Cyclobacteriaceae bacterium]|nr:amidohydrolase family protein [Cyclobacteriaceae bacterium]
MKRVLIFCLGVACVQVVAQEKPLDMKMDFEQYDPPSTLKVEEHRLKRAKFPFIDIHNHQGNMNTSDFKDLIAKMDALNMAVMINLSGRGFRSSGDHLEKSIENINNRYPNRFVLFTNVDFTDIDNPEWGARTVKQLEADIKRGAKGLKIYKSLGIHNKDSKGNRISINDPRIDPIWAKCGELGVPVLIHSADPKPFWDP